MQTITGRESCSASLKAWRCTSTASWQDSTYSWIQPESRWDIESRVIVPDVDRRTERPVGDRHHNRQSESGRVVHGFRHVQQPLAGGRG